MAFVNSNVARRPITKGIDNAFSRVGKPTTVKEFVDSFGGLVKPTLKIPVNVDIKFVASVKGEEPPKPPSKSKSKNGNRPHKSRAYRPLKERQASDVIFSSNISTGLLVDPMEDNTSSYSTLYLLCGSILPESGQNSVIRKLMNDLVFNEFLSECQTKINYRIDSDLTSEKFYKYIRSISSAIQLYYYVDSILTYCKNDSIVVKNTGIQHLRSQLTSEIISQHVYLGEILCQYPMPPNILNFIRYMYQNFTLVEDIESPIIRLAFRETLHEGKHISLSPEYYDVIIDEIRSVGTRVPNIIKTTFPNMMFNEMPLSSSSPIFDKNFLTFWVNNCVTYLNDAKDKILHSRNVKDKKHEFNYFTYINKDYDGLFLSCNSIFNLSSECFHTGIWSPIDDVTKFKGFAADMRSSLLCYNSEERRLVTPRSSSTLSQSGLYHGVYYDVDSGKYESILMAPAGSLKYQSATLNLLDQATSLSMYFLLGLPMIKSNRLR